MYNHMEMMANAILLISAEGKFDGHSALWWALLGGTIGIVLVVINYFLKRKK